MIVSVDVGFLYTLYEMLLSVFWMVMSKTFILLLVSFSIVNVSVGEILFNSLNISWVFVKLSL